MVGLATLMGSSRLILVGLATLTGSSRLRLMNLKGEKLVFGENQNSNRTDRTLIKRLF